MFVTADPGLGGFAGTGGEQILDAVRVTNPLGGSEIMDMLTVLWIVSLVFLTLFVFLSFFLLHQSCS